MTQKELLYIEDAIGHEENIISILESTIENLEDQNLVTFLKKEIKVHENLRTKLMEKLEGLANVWSNTNG